ncbi:MAG TPA: hypothetical protein VJQ85_00740 [Gaiellaceae bacterium]|nr:hypothetical protein [Gaiellaceae bacterium]
MGAPRFDFAALYRSLDEMREKRGVSWQQLAAEMGVAASTLKRTRTGGAMEADGVLPMVRLVGKAPEDFTEGASRAAKPLEPGRLDTQALHAALDTARRERGLTWTAAAREIGPWGADALRRLAQGGRIRVDLMLACTQWLGREVNDFVDTAFRHPA